MHDASVMLNVHCVHDASVMLNVHDAHCMSKGGAHSLLVRRLNSINIPTTQFFLLRTLKVVHSQIFAEPKMRFYGRIKISYILLVHTKKNKKKLTNAIGSFAIFNIGLGALAPKNRKSENNWRLLRCA